MSNLLYYEVHWFDYAVEFHLSGLIGTARHPDMQKIRIIGFFFANRLHWPFELVKEFLQTANLGCMFIYVQIKQYIIPFLCFLCFVDRASWYAPCK